MPRPLFSLALLTFPFAAAAGEHATPEVHHPTHPPTASFVNGVTYTFNSDFSSIMTVHGLRAAFLLTDQLKWSAEAGVAIVIPALDLAVYVQTGPGVILTNHFQFSAYGTWKAHLHHETMEHLIGGVIAPTFVTSFGNVNIPLGVQCAVSGHEECFGVAGVKLVVDLRP